MEDCLEQPLATPEEEWDDEFSASQVLRRPSPNKVARAAPPFLLAGLWEKQKLRTGEAHSLGPGGWQLQLQAASPPDPVPDAWKLHMVNFGCWRCRGQCGTRWWTSNSQSLQHADASKPGGFFDQVSRSGVLERMHAEASKPGGFFDQVSRSGVLERMHAEASKPGGTHNSN